MSHAAENKNLLQRYVSALQAGDTDAVRAFFAEEDQVVMQWTSRARTRDGRPYENGCIGVFTLRDGAIVSVREYMDTLYAGTAFAALARAA